jgi:NAD(P)-dependent dehydrogenase (short-subunit alcohol dehydrogenase family)
MADLSGKVAVITGAASGIGVAGVETFVAAGAKVIAGDIQDEKGRALEARFGTDKVRYVHCDVMDLAELEAVMEAAISHFGQLDIAWNNAGSGGSPASIEELDEAGYDLTMNLLLKQVFFGTQYAAARMTNGGSIVNTSSVSALMAGYAPITYSVAKIGVAHFSRIAAAQLAKNKVRVNAILPGFIATSIFGASLGMSREVADQMAEMLAQQGGSMQPIGRVGKGSDIAEMAAFLASDAAGFITGSQFTVDGGITVGPRHSWDESAGGPILEALGITPEQAEQMAAAQRG